MAGEWIKIEKGTPDKPEMLALAAKLGMSQAEVFLLCFRLWAWADSNSTDGVLRGITPDVLDSVLFHRRGFAQALVDVGWLQRIRVGEDSSESLAITRFDRHLSQSAKKRANDTDRQRRGRDRGGTDSDVAKLSRCECDKNVTPLFSLSSSSSSPREGEEGGSGGEGETARPRDGPADGQPWPQFLAAEWCFWFAGTQASQRNLEALDKFFGDLMGQVSPERIWEALKDRKRAKRMTTWDFEKYLGVKTNGHSSDSKRGR